MGLEEKTPSSEKQWRHNVSQQLSHQRQQHKRITIDEYTNKIGKKIKAPGINPMPKIDGSRLDRAG